MAANAPDHSQLSIVPLGAGDLIDRAVRFYRNNFFTLILIASPPILIGTILNVSWTLLARSMFVPGGSNSFDSMMFIIFSSLGAMIIWFIETTITLAVMGGASRNFVRHLLDSEPINFRETYKNVWQRLGGLLVASATITILLSITGLFVFYFGFGVGAIVIVLITAAFAQIPVLSFIFGIALAIIFAFAIYSLFCLIAVRFAFIPQVMLVEGQGVLASFGRSFSLAGGNSKRFAALLLFTVVATYSALAVIYVPLGWYGWFEGIDIFSIGAGELKPAWYEIASQLSWQMSLILLSPVWMIGLCLLYVDERVRKEGYDIELMATRRLGEIPSVPYTYQNPLQPAIAESGAVPAMTTKDASPGMTTLGLK